MERGPAKKPRRTNGKDHRARHYRPRHGSNRRRATYERRRNQRGSARLPRGVADHRLGIGTDFTTGGEDLIIASRRVAGPGQPISDATIPYATGLDRYELLGNLTRGLFERGFNASAVSGILGANYLRVLRGVEEAAC